MNEHWVRVNKYLYNSFKKIIEGIKQCILLLANKVCLCIGNRNQPPQLGTNIAFPRRALILEGKEGAGGRE